MTAMETIKRQVKLCLESITDGKIKADFLGDEDYLFGEEVGLTSLAFVQLILLLEEEFQIEIPVGNIDMELFQSVSSIARYIYDYESG